jgi:hypothetical protein
MISGIPEISIKTEPFLIKATHFLKQPEPFPMRQPEGFDVSGK